MSPQSMTTDELLDKLLLESQKLNLEAHEPDYPVAIEPPVAGAPELVLPYRQHYYLEELLKYNGDAFVRNAFRALLQREPDEDGFRIWRHELDHDPSRITLLLKLQGNEEAARHNVTIEGLERFRRLQTGRLAKLLPRIAFWLMRRLQQRYESAGRHLQVDEIEQALTQVETLRQACATTLDQISQASWSPLGTLRQIETRQRVLEERLNQGAPQVAEKVSPGGQDSQNEPDPELDAFYLAFEAECRGTREQIQARLAPYLEHLPSQHLVAEEPANRAVDLGCGRGEWLEMLRDHGYAVEGVDNSPLMREHCAARGLTVHDRPLLEWLRSQPDDAFAVVSAFHLVEHLPFGDVLRLTRQAWRILAPGGIMILETPNPENMLVATHTFHHDPTHHNPLTPTLLSFTARHNGFDDVQVLRLNPYPPEAGVPGEDACSQRVNGHFCGPQDFSVVARKSASETA